STTWAMQNPSKDPQPAHIHSKRTLTSAEKITCNPRRKVLQDNNEEFQEDIALFQKEWDSKIQDLAKKHSKTVDGVHLLLTNATHYKKSCAPTLHNALIHYKSEELQDLVAEDPELQNLSSAHKKELKDNVIVSRKLKVMGVWASNLGATMDAKATMERLVNFAERVGSYTFAFFTRGHVHDTNIPGWVASNKAILFFQEVLHLDPLDVATKFEQWACTRERVPLVDTLHPMHIECMHLVLQGLNIVVKGKAINMNFINYDIAIVQKHKVELVGWSAMITFGNPSAIGTVGTVQMLQEALTTLTIGEYKWIAQTKHQQAVHAAMLKMKCDTGDTIRKKRKQQSDKGKKRS
ncbi:hypothetical protein L208DRAFT_1018964, partial [Tricholoma matsutake]